MVDTKITTKPTPAPVFATLQERLAGGRDAARAAHAQVLRENLDLVVDHLIKGLEGLAGKIPQVESEEDWMRHRAELAEFLRGAGSAVAPRSV